MDSYEKALSLEADNAEAKEGLYKTMAKINERGSGEKDEERAQRAMADPEIQVRNREGACSSSSRKTSGALRRSSLCCRKIIGLLGIYYFAMQSPV